jgi:membrane fusion protein YbhG
VKWHSLVALSGLGLFLASCRPPAGPPSVSGTIETDEVHVASRHGGRVEKLPAREGAILTNGQTIAILDAPELRAQRAQVEAELAELVAGPRKEEIATARAESEAVAAELELARLEAKRAEQLFADKTVPESERDRAATRVATLEKSLAASRSRYDLLLAGTRPERIARARARLDELATHERELRVTTPTNCVLEVLSVKVGDVLPPNRELATLLMIEHLWVRVYVPQPWLGHIQLDQQVRVRADSFPEKEFAGTVEQIGRAAEFTPRNIQTPAERIKQVFAVKVRLPADQLRAGMSVDVFFPNVPAPEPTPGNSQ